MNIGDKVKISGTNSIWDGKTGIVESMEDNMCIVFVDFIPGENKMVRQDFPLDNLQTYTDADDLYVDKVAESMNLKEADDSNKNEKVIKLLSDLLKFDDEEVEQLDDHLYSVGNREYWVGTEDEAREYALELAKEILDDMGLESLSDSYKEYICSDDNFLDVDAISEMMREDYEIYVEDIETEDDDVYGNRLIQEMYDAGILTDDDFLSEDGEIDYTQLKVDLDDKKEEFIEYLCEQQSAIEWLEGIYGAGKELSDFLAKNNLIDFDAVAEDVVDTDGCGPQIASYDGKELYLDDDLYAYRVN